ncbi:hypothetical protein D3C85_1067480 [compost metagenome]
MGGSKRVGLIQRRARAPSSPLGAIHSTNSSSTEKISNRYSAKSDSSSGTSTISSAPTSGPNSIPLPPTITASTNRMDWENGKDSGLMNISKGASKLPASPVNAADRANARVLLMTGLKPSERAAISDAFTARMALPQLLWLKR